MGQEGPRCLNDGKAWPFHAGPDDQRVRTMAGWIGVEISRSRVRTPGKPGYGLYRVRGSVGRVWRSAHELAQAGVKPSAVTDDMHGERGEWTAYAFGLGVIEAAVRNSIEQGRPAGPMALHLVEDASAIKTGESGYAGGCVVPTRWTQAYTGRRDLGVGLPVAIKREFAEEVSALAALVDEGLIVMTHVPDWCSCEGTSRLTAACVRATVETEQHNGQQLR